MKVVFNTKDLNKELKNLKKGQSILLQEREIVDRKDYIEFQKYMWNLMIMKRQNEIKINAGLIFKKV